MKHLYYAKRHQQMPGNKDVKRILHVLFAFLVPLLIFSACMEDDFEGDLMDVCPRVENHSPDAQEGVLINSIITASFNKDMKEESINAMTFVVSDANGIIDGDIEYSELNRTVTFIPEEDFKWETEVTVEITTEVYDLYDFTIPEPFKWSFITEPLIIPPLEVVSTVPEKGAVDVSLATEISATFNEHLDVSAITQESLLLYNKDNNQKVDGVVTYENMKLSFWPDEILDYDTHYEAIVVSDDLRGINGNELVEDYHWEFRTEEEEEVDIITIPVNIDQIANYAILAGTHIWNTEGTSSIIGDIGIFPGVITDIDGFDLDNDVDGQVFAEGIDLIWGLDLKLIRDKMILARAYNEAKNAHEPEPQFLSGDQGGMTLPSGIYKANKLRIFNGDLVLDAENDPNAFWIFQVESLLETGGNIILANGANPERIIWQIGVREIFGPNVLIGAHTEFVGTVLSKQGISVGYGASINGRLMVKDGGVYLKHTTIERP